MNELRRILIALREKYGKPTLSKVHRTEYMRIEKTDRKTVMYYIVKTLQLKGKERSYFDGSSVQREIVDFFFPDESIEGMPKSKIKNGKAVAMQELESVIERIWPTDGLYDGPIVEPARAVTPLPKMEDNVPSTLVPTGQTEEIPTIPRKEVDWDQLEKKSKYERPQLDPEWAELMGLETDE